MASDESLVDLHASSITDDKDDVDSLPSESTSDLYSEADSEAQAEWDRSLEQLQLLLTMILVPWMGKLFGRKFAYWSELPRISPAFLPLHGSAADDCSARLGWGKYMNWVHNVDVQVTNRKSFNAAGAVAATL